MKKRYDFYDNTNPHRRYVELKSLTRKLYGIARHIFSGGIIAWKNLRTGRYYCGKLTSEIL
jgi:hypothetical protein